MPPSPAPLAPPSAADLLLRHARRAALVASITDASRYATDIAGRCEAGALYGSGTAVDGGPLGVSDYHLATGAALAELLHATLAVLDSTSGAFDRAEKALDTLRGADGLWGPV